MLSLEFVPVRPNAPGLAPARVRRSDSDTDLPRAVCFSRLLDTVNVPQQIDAVTLALDGDLENLVVPAPSLLLSGYIQCAATGWTPQWSLEARRARRTRDMNRPAHPPARFNRLTELTDNARVSTYLSDRTLISVATPEHTENKEQDETNET